MLSNVYFELCKKNLKEILQLLIKFKTSYKWYYTSSWKSLTILAKSSILDVRLALNMPLTQTVFLLLYSYNARWHLTFPRLIRKPEKNVNHLNAAKKGNAKAAKKPKAFCFHRMPTRQDLICLWFSLIQFWGKNITLN